MRRERVIHDGILCKRQEETVSRLAIRLCILFPSLIAIRQENFFATPEPLFFALPSLAGSKAN
jgi:hypothetical protein